jgi:aminoglycoside phosphotransferase (APT) family kinase protein
MTQPMWTADIAVDTALAARLIAKQFPALRGEAVEPFGIGWDNAAFLVGGRIVFRFPRRRVCANLIEREIAILPLVAPHLPLAVPAPRYAGAATAEYPWVFAGYDLIEGTTSCSVELSAGARAALAEPLGRFLRALHAVDTAPLVARGLPPDEIGRLDHAKRLPVSAERLAALAESPVWATTGVAAEPERFIEWLAAHPPVALADDARTLVHGDLYARHILVDANARPSGVIDWGDVHLGDPALDVQIAHLVLPASAHGAFRAAYGPIDERTWSAARYRAIYHAILELDYGVRADDAGMRASGAQALRLIEAALTG